METTYLIVLYDKMGSEISTDIYVHYPLNVGDTIIHKDITYEVRSRQYQTLTNILFIRAYSSIWRGM